MQTSENLNESHSNNSDEFDPDEIREDRSRWDKEQDLYLQTIVQNSEETNWAEIADRVNSNFPHIKRNGKQCRERWRNHLHPSIDKHNWTNEEELRLVLAHRKWKNHWSETAALFKGRNNNMVKNRFYSVFRKIRNKILKDDRTFSGKLELAEAFYIISLIEYYYEHPIPVDAPKLKRGKDFIYSLITKLKMEQVKVYKEKIAALGNMEDLFKELEKEGADPPLEKINIEEDKNVMKPEYKVPEIMALPSPSNFGNIQLDHFFPVYIPNKEQISPSDRLPTRRLPEYKTGIYPEPLSLDDKNGFISNAFRRSSLSSVEDAPCQFMQGSPSGLSAGPAATAAAANAAKCFHPTEKVSEDNIGGFASFATHVSQSNRKNTGEMMSMSPFSQKTENPGQSIVRPYEPSVVRAQIITYNERSSAPGVLQPKSNEEYNMEANITPANNIVLPINMQLEMGPK